MRHHLVRRVTSLAVALTLAAFAAALSSPMAEAADLPLTPLQISPSSGCGLVTAYTGGPGLPSWSSPAPPCGTGPFTMAFNQGNGAPLATASGSGGVGMAGSALLAWSASVPDGAKMGYRIAAPPGITITNVVYDIAHLQNIGDGHGWIGLTYSNSGAKQLPLPGTAVDAAASPRLNTNYWGIELRCVQSTCTWPGEIQLDHFTVFATEASGPSITSAADSSSVWSHAGPDQWIWNAPGDPWPLPVSAGDSSGVCSLSVQAGASPAIADSSLPKPNSSSWQECQQPVSWTAAVDTREYVSGAGQLPVTLQATNAAGLSNAPTSQILNVDNDPVTVSLSTPNDPNPTVWVNHAVTVDAAPSTGPSGLGGMSCGVDGATAQSYPAGGLTVDGDGVKTVTCTAWNNAVDPQGNHNSSTSSMTVHIDEAPPAISFQPENPADPTGVAVDTSDTESGVAAGSIEMAPAGTTNWTTLPTTFSGSQLLAHFNDAGVHGPYAFKATSCDNVGNCASATRTLALPVRVAAVSQVSIENIPASRCAGRPATHAAAASAVKGARPAASDVPQAIEPGSSLVRMGSSGLDRAPRAHPSSRMPEAGLSLTSDASFAGLRVPPTPVSIAAGTNLATRADTSRLLARSRPNRPRRHGTVASAARGAALARSCSGDLARLANRGRVGYGRAVTVHGLLMSGGGLPLAGQPVAVLTAPDNGSNVFTEATAVTTTADGSWTATLPAGPSRVIEASYPGSPTILPASGYATVITPAKIVLRSVTPDRTPWGSTVTITGRVLGGYIPASSKLLRLDLGVVGIPGLSKIQGIPNVSTDGRFTTTYTFGHAYGVVRFWLMVSSLAEADFPWAAAHSRRVIVTVGVAAPPPPPHRLVSRSHHHRHKHKHRARAHPRHKRP